jgi:hypothetical protein
MAIELSGSVGAVPDIQGKMSLSTQAFPGETLTTDDGTWVYHPDTITYQWTKDTVDIPTETNNNYIAVTGDIGSDIACDITATNGEGNDTESSNSISIIAAT